MHITTSICFDFFNRKIYVPQPFTIIFVSPKTITIRYLKNISLIIATTLAISALAIMALNPEQKPAAPQPSTGSSSPGRKVEVEKAKKNSVLRRFISYTDVPSFH